MSHIEHFQVKTLFPFCAVVVYNSPAQYITGIDQSVDLVLHILIVGGEINRFCYLTRASTIKFSFCFKNWYLHDSLITSVTLRYPADKWHYYQW